MPESYCSVAGTGDKSCERAFRLQRNSFLGFSQSYFPRRIDFLDVVDGPIVREESPTNLDFGNVLHVPQEDHFVTINCNNSVPLLIWNYGNSIRKPTSLVLGDLDLLYAGLDVCGAKRRWFLEGDHVLQGLGIEDPDHSVGASTEERVCSLVDGAAIRLGYLNIHPLA